MEPERTLRPRETIPVEVMARVCPRNVRAALTFVVVYGEDSGIFAERMEREKSAPDVKTTLEDGKKRRDVTVLRWALPVAEGAALPDDVGRMYTDPSW